MEWITKWKQSSSNRNGLCISDWLSCATTRKCFFMVDGAEESVEGRVRYPRPNIGDPIASSAWPATQGAGKIHGTYVTVMFLVWHEILLWCIFLPIHLCALWPLLSAAPSADASLMDILSVAFAPPTVEYYSKSNLYLIYCNIQLQTTLKLE